MHWPNLYPSTGLWSSAIKINSLPKDDSNYQFVKQVLKGARDRVRISSHSVYKIPNVLRVFVNRSGEIIFARSLRDRAKIYGWPVKKIIREKRVCFKGYPAGLKPLGKATFLSCPVPYPVVYSCFSGLLTGRRNYCEQNIRMPHVSDYSHCCPYG